VLGRKTREKETTLRPRRRWEDNVLIPCVAVVNYTESGVRCRV
jgi:hypothetical protein